MRRWSSPRRSHRARRGGISAVAGAVFLVVIIATLTTGIIFWSMTAQRELSHLDVRRASQELVIHGVEFVGGGTRYVVITVNNTSPEAVHIITVWFIDNNASPPTHYKVNETGIDGSWVPEGACLWNITVYWPGWASGDVYIIKLITDLGRAFVTVEKAP